MGDKQGCIGRVGQFYICVAGEESIPESLDNKAISNHNQD